MQIQKGKIIKTVEANYPSNENYSSSQSQDTRAGEDSGIAASESSNKQIEEKYYNWTDKKRACQGLVCEGLLLLLRDTLRVFPDSKISLILKNVLRAELLIVLSNNPDSRVRTALIKIIHTYLDRSTDEDINKFIKQKYFVHLANQISFYPGSEPLVVTLEKLVFRGPGFAAMPTVLAMIPKAAATDFNVAKPLISFVTYIISKVRFYYYSLQKIEYYLKILKITFLYFRI